MQTNVISAENNQQPQATAPEPGQASIPETGQTAISEAEQTAAPQPEQNLAPEPARVAGLVPRAFWTAKSGNSETDYEDGWAVGADCLAIGDGATESSFARLWAQALTAGFVMQPDAIFPLHTERPEHCRARIQEWTQPLQTAWHSRVPWNNLPWFAEDKARAGAFATLLAFQIQGNKGKGIRDKIEESGDSNQEQTAYSLPLIPYPFQVFAIGDSCLFQIRDSRVKLAFPLQHSSQFDSTPPLLSSNPANNKRVWDNIVIEEGMFQAGDILLFATDALARWFLAEVEAGNLPWHELCGLKGQAEFEAFVTRLRQAHAMRNDDVTLVIVDASELPQVAASASALADAVTAQENGVSGSNALPEPSPSEQTSAVFAGTSGVQDTVTEPKTETTNGAEHGAIAPASAMEINTQGTLETSTGIVEANDKEEAL